MRCPPLHVWRRTGDEQTIQLTHDSIEVRSFQYEDLPQGHIRILKLYPGTGDEPVKCRLVPIPLVSRTRFEAISYVWGDPTITADVLCDGFRFPVTVNLRDALVRLRSRTSQRALCRFPRTTASGMFTNDPSQHGRG